MKSFAQHYTPANNRVEILTQAAALQSLLAQQYYEVPIVVWVDSTEKA